MKINKRVFLDLSKKFISGITITNIIAVQVLMLGLFIVQGSALAVGTTATIYSSKDSRVIQNNGNTNYGTSNNLKVTSQSGSKNKRSFIEFDLSLYSIHTIVSSAQVFIYMDSAPAVSRSYDIYSVTGSWEETGINWNNKPAKASSKTSSVESGTTDNVWKTFDVTTDTQSFVNGSMTNNGWTIKDSTESSATKYEGNFLAKEETGTASDPYLSMTYYCDSGWTGTYCDVLSDVTSPILTEITPVPTIANDNSPDYTFNSDEAGSITYTGSCSSATTSAIAGDNTITLDTLIDGLYSDCTITVTDAVGNSSTPLSLTAFTIDTLLPSVSGVDSDGETYTLNTSSPHTITITFSEDIANTPDIDVHSVPVDPQVVNDCSDGDAKTFCFDYTIASLQETTHTIYITNAQDIAGNTMITDNSHTFIVDTLAPALSFDDSVETGPVMSDNIAINFGDSAVIKYGFVSSSEDCNTLMDVSGFTDYTTNYLINADLQNGNYACVYGEDSVGNKSALISDNPFNIDTTAPTITINNPDTNPAQSKDISAETNEGVLYMIENSSTCDAESDPSFTAYSSLTFTLESNNGQTICYKAVDEAGNKNYALSNAIGGIDATNPTGAITAPAEGSYVKGTIEVTADAVDDEGSGIQSVEFYYASIGTIFSTDTESPYSANWDTTSVVDGEHSLWVVATDNAGNNITSETISVIVDNTAPVISLTTPASGSYNTPISISGNSTDEPSTTIKYVHLYYKSSTDEGWTEIDTNSELEGIQPINNTESAEPFSYNYSWTPSLEGKYSIGVRAEDKAENWSGEGPADVSVNNVAYDITGPVITVPSDITEETTSSSGKIVAYTAPTAVDAIDGSVIATCDHNSGDNFVIGTTTITCSAVDTAVNNSEKTFKVTVNQIQQSNNSGGGGGTINSGFESSLLINNEATLVNNVSETSATITWTTSYASSSHVIYAKQGEAHILDYSDSSGTPPKYGYANTTLEQDISPKVINHSVTITGLTPGAVYYYRTVSHGSLAIGDEKTFTTTAGSSNQAIPVVQEQSNTGPVVVVQAEQISYPTEQTSSAEQVSQPSEQPVEEAIEQEQVSPVIEQPVQEQAVENNPPSGLLAAIGGFFSANKVVITILLIVAIALIVLESIYLFSKRRKKN